MENEKYISLGVLAQETGLSKVVLKRYADKGQIPVLKTLKQPLFKLSAVQNALARLAASKERQQRPTVLGGHNA